VSKLQQIRNMEASFSKLSLEENDTKISAEKDKIRQNVWSKLEKKRQVRTYPPSCFGKIPNFKGNQHAAERVTKLSEFKNAKVIKINPSLAQMDLRYHVMKANKVLIGTLLQRHRAQSQSPIYLLDSHCRIFTSNIH
jgi:5-formyltetrahydrofolate cyclo-ligase